MSKNKSTAPLTATQTAVVVTARLAAVAWTLEAIDIHIVLDVTHVSGSLSKQLHRYLKGHGYKRKERDRLLNTYKDHIFNV